MRIILTSIFPALVVIALLVGGGACRRDDKEDCCRVCDTGKACGDTCINKELTCHVGAGCACNVQQ